MSRGRGTVRACYNPVSTPLSLLFTAVQRRPAKCAAPGDPTTRSIQGSARHSATSIAPGKPHYHLATSRRPQP